MVGDAGVNVLSLIASYPSWSTHADCDLQIGKVYVTYIHQLYVHSWCLPSNDGEDQCHTTPYKQAPLRSWHILEVGVCSGLKNNEQFRKEQGAKKHYVGDQ